MTKQAVSNKTFLITGGTSRLGQAVVLKALEQGASVFLTYHQNQKAAEALAEKGAHIFKLDLADTAQIDAFAAELKNKIEHLDVLIHNAALVRDHTIQNLTEEDWDSVMSVNLKAPYYLTKKLFSLLFLKKNRTASMPMSSPAGFSLNQHGEVRGPMKPSSSPHVLGGDPKITDSRQTHSGMTLSETKQVAAKIFMITSRAAITGGFGISNYVASKAGLIGLTKSLAQEIGKRQILVNAVNPGFMKSKMTESLPENVLQQQQELSPLGRYSDPEEVADFLIYLSSDQMTQVTGQVFHFESRKI